MLKTREYYKILHFLKVESVDRIYPEPSSGVESVGAFGLVPGDDSAGKLNIRDFVLGIIRKLINGA